MYIFFLHTSVSMYTVLVYVWMEFVLVAYGIFDKQFSNVCTINL